MAKEEGEGEEGKEPVGGRLEGWKAGGLEGWILFPVPSPQPPVPLHKPYPNSSGSPTTKIPFNTGEAVP